MNKLTVALIQQSCTNNRQQNVEKSINMIHKAAAQGAQLIVLQELHSDSYFCRTEDPKNFSLAESIPGPLTELFAQAAQATKTVLIGSFFEKRAPGIYHNTAVVFEQNGHIAGKYRKMHIPDDPGYYEKFYFTPGDLGFKPIETSLGKIGVLVCWDQWFPEAARLMALAGADLLIYPTAIGWDTEDSAEEKHRQQDAWITIQRSHAIANGIPLLSVNRIGDEGEKNSGEAWIQFWGNSFVAGCQGEVLAQASSHKEAIVISEIDMSRQETVRRIWPFFRDRRIDAYEELTLRFRDGK